VSRWLASAPGKLVLLGEYAVLDGAPALVMAVERYCRVELAACEPPACRVEAPQLDRAVMPFSLDGGRPVWTGTPVAGLARTLDLVDAALTHVLALGGQPRPFWLRVDTAELFQDGPRGLAKLGLGSSAASAVAIDAAIHAAFAPTAAKEDRRAMIDRLRETGRRAQRGEGSGIDLAAAVCGGVLAYRLECNDIELKPVALPTGLVLVPVWAGEPASTTELIAAWRRAADRQPQRHARVLEQMQAIARTGLDAVYGQDLAGLLDSLSEYGRIMVKMNDLLSRPVVTPEHQAAMRIAESLGGVYKPCGAGGGDLGVAAASDPAFAGRFDAACRQAGLTILPMSPASAGVQVKRE